MFPPTMRQTRHLDNGSFSWLPWPRTSTGLRMKQRRLKLVQPTHALPEHVDQALRSQETLVELLLRSIASEGTTRDVFTLSAKTTPTVSGLPRRECMPASTARLHVVMSPKHSEYVCALLRGLLQSAGAGFRKSFGFSTVWNKTKGLRKELFRDIGMVPKDRILVPGPFRACPCCSSRPRHTCMYLSAHGYIFGYPAFDCGLSLIMLEYAWSMP